jgi:hypothetical protein
MVGEYERQCRLMVLGVGSKEMTESQVLSFIGGVESC